MVVSDLAGFIWGRTAQGIEVERHPIGPRGTALPRASVDRRRCRRCRRLREPSLHELARTQSEAVERKSFREVRDDLLARRAVGHVREGVPVAQVASLLGYHDASGFRRARKRWFGVTPDDWRRSPSPSRSVRLGR